MKNDFLRGACLGLFASLLLVSVTNGMQEPSETISTAAKKAFDQGVLEMEKGNNSGAMSLLKTAVRIEPENGLYHHRLSQAFLKLEKYHDMWVHLRKASMLEPGNREYATDFLRLWRYHDLQGTLNVGTAAGTVLKAMGEPDKRIENQQMMRWIYGFMAVDFGTRDDGGRGVFRVIDLRGYTAEAAAELETVRVLTDSKKWRVAHHQISRTSDNLELTTKGERIQNWTELFSKQRLPLMSKTGGTLAGMLGSIRKSLQAVDPEVNFHVISESPEAIVYHWATHATENNPAQHEIAKIMKGQKDFYRVAYVKKTERLSEQEFATWSKVIGDAKLVPVNTGRKSDANEQVQSNTRDSQSGPENSDLHSWRLGKHLAIAALVRGKHGPDDVVKKSLLAASKLSQSLEVSIPAPAAVTDDANADTAAAIEFLLSRAGKPIYNSLEAGQGESKAALFELGVKTTLLRMLYQPGDSTSEALATAIRRSAVKAELGEDVWKPLLEKINDQEQPKIIAAELQQFEARVERAISNQLE